jgi:hypothetical protein
VPLSDQTLTRAEELIARYPQPRSALLPILFLLQAEDGYVSPAGVAQAAQLLGLTKAEVGAAPEHGVEGGHRPDLGLGQPQQLRDLGDPGRGHVAVLGLEQEQDREQGRAPLRVAGDQLLGSGQGLVGQGHGGGGLLRGLQRSTPPRTGSVEDRAAMTSATSRPSVISEAVWRLTNDGSRTCTR